MTTIPQDWFIGDEHEMYRIAWFLYDNESQFDPDLLSQLVEHLKDLESDTFIEMGDFKHRLAHIQPEKPKAEKKMWKKAEEIVLEKAQKQEMARRKKISEARAKDLEKNPILALTEEQPEEKPIPSSLYDYYDADRIKDLCTFEYNKLKREKKKGQEADAQKTKKKVTKKPKKKKGVASV